MDINPEQLAISVAGMGLAIHKALSEAGNGLIEAAMSMPDGSAGQQRTFERGRLLMERNQEVAEHISEILTLLSKAAKS